MAVKLTPRYLEVMTILRDNPDGLTTSQILQIARADKGTSLKDSTVVSYVVNVLREDKRFVVSNGSLAGIIHRVTPLGLKQFEQPTEQFHKAVPVEHPQETVQFEAAISTIRSLVKPQKVVKDLQLKLDVLAKLYPLMSDDICKVLTDISGDLTE